MDRCDLSCYDYLLEKTKEYNDYCCIEYLGKKISKKRFFTQVNNLANYFLSLGLKKGDAVCIFLPNTPHALVGFYALNKIGVIASTVHPLTPPEVLEKSIYETKAKYVFILDILAKNYIPMFNRIGIPVILCRNSDYFLSFKPFFRLYEFFKCRGQEKILNKIKYYKAVKYKDKHTSPTLSGDLIATYMRSGGTSGEEKTVMLSNSSYNNIAKNLLAMATNIENASKERALAVLPIFHAYGLGVGIHSPLCKAMTIILIPQFNAKKTVDILCKNKIAFIAGVPALFSKILQEKKFSGQHLKNLKHLYSGGDVTNSALINSFNETVKNAGGEAKLCAGYGLTETCSVVVTNKADSYKIGSNGKCFFEGNIIEIWDENNNKLPAGTIGEIVITGKTIMSGYLGSKDNGIFRDKKGVNWIKTGDLGYLDEEGFLFFSSRKKRIIIISTFNIFPSVIDNAVAELPFIREACAVEARKGEKTYIKLYITVKDGYEYCEDMKKMILAHCKAKLFKHAVPREIELLKEMPRTKFAKIDYVKLTKRSKNGIA